MLQAIEAKNGRTLYYNDGKMISKARYEELQTVDQPDEPRQTETKPQALCIFCGEPAENSRFINLQTIPLCEEDYHHTTGEVVEQLRNRDDCD